MMLGKLHSRKLFRWIGRKRGEVSCAIAMLSLIDVFWGDAWPIDVLTPSLAKHFVGYWMLLLAGVAMRVWAAGNRRKHEVDSCFYAFFHPSCRLLSYLSRQSIPYATFSV